MDENMINNRQEEQQILFIKGGKLIESRYVPVHSKLFEADFPNIPCKAGKRMIWCYHYRNKGYRQMVMTPFTVPGYVEGMAPIERVVFEAFEIVTDDIAVVDAHTVAVHTTEKNPALGTVDIRFIAALHSLQASAVGMDITAKYSYIEKSFKTESTRVYSAINDFEGETAGVVKACELGGTYLYAFTVTDVPVGGMIEFLISAYVKVDGEITARSEPMTVKVLNGWVQQSFEA